MSETKRFSEALDYHERGRPGKFEIRATKPTATQADLSLAYTPGVAEPSLAIAEDGENVFRYTNRGNLVAVVSNGTAVLGLGDIGPMGAKPVMEGKAVLFKRFADIDVFDIEVATHDADELIRFCELLEPTVGGINLEDIKAPECFYIEQTLKQRLDIPVFHDDQHGTAIIAGAGFLNALELVDKDIADVRVVFSGAGAAGIATARFFKQLGVRTDNILLVDSKGVIYEGREEFPEHKAEFAVATDRRTLAEALDGADAFVGVSVAGTVDGSMIQPMAKSPIIFALANPDPEIPYAEARDARPDAIVATGRSDFPNQVNNVLGFPFIFRGALDVRTKAITEGMKVAAATALADLTREPVVESVLKAYELNRLSFGPDYIIPKPFDPRVLWWVAPAVAGAASQEGVALSPLADPETYREALQQRFSSSYGIISLVTDKAQERPMRVVFPHGADTRIIRAARRVVDEKIASPTILGNEGAVRDLATEYGVDLDGIEIVNPAKEIDDRFRYADVFFQLRHRKGVTLEDARRMMFNPNAFGVMMLQQGEADAVVGGLTSYYPDTLRPALQVLPLEEGRTIVSALYVIVAKGKPYVFCDCAVNIEPTAEQLAEIALAAADSARRDFDMQPQVAFVSYSNFGSADGEEPMRIRRAVDICHTQRPELAVEGEMQADLAVSPELLAARHPFNRLSGGANVLVFPDLTAANAAYKLLHTLGGAEVIGPVLTGLSRSVHVLQRDAEVGDIVNLTAIAVLDAQRKAR